MIATYRKRPLVVEAVHFVGKESGDFIVGWANAEWVENGRALLIQTLEGDLRADHGDWVIRGAKGEFYPCKADIFAMTYENAP